MSRDINPFGLRMPTELKDKIELEAKKNHRSMNAEIIAMLELALSSSDCLDESRMKELMREVIQEELTKLKI